MFNKTHINFETAQFYGIVKNRDEACLYNDESNAICNLTGSGTVTYNSGEVYTGDILNGKFNGRGRMTYGQNGKSVSFYDGEWRNGVQHGRGVYVDESGWRAESEWSNAVMKGISKIYFPDKTVYKGTTLQNQISGTGKLYRKKFIGSRLIYEGSWLNGTYHGYGTLHYPTGEIWYCGEWLEGVCHGNGTLFNRDGVILQKGVFDNGNLVTQSRLNIVSKNPLFTKSAGSKQSSIRIAPFPIFTRIKRV